MKPTPQSQNSQPQERRKREPPPVVPCSLWNNDMVTNASKAMSKQDLDKYAKLGESMYKDVDFETSAVNIPPFMKDAVICIEESLKSGLHPSMMPKEEKELMRDVYGEAWYSKYGYVKGDLDDFVTYGYNPASVSKE